MAKSEDLFYFEMYKLKVRPKLYQSFIAVAEIEGDIQHPSCLSIETELSCLKMSVFRTDFTQDCTNNLLPPLFGRVLKLILILPGTQK